MIKRHHQVLAAVLVAQVVLSVVVFWPRPSTAGQREPLFPDLGAEDVTALTVADAEGNMIALAKVTGEWVLPEADQYPAKGDQVSKLLDGLTALNTGRLVTSSDTSHRRLQVAAEDFVRRVTLRTSDGTEKTVYFGSSPQYGSMHFRLGSESETYLTSELTIWDVNPATGSWIDPSYQSVAQADVTRLALENANGRFVFEREGEETWKAVELPSTEEDDTPLNGDQALDQIQIRAVLGRAASVRMNTPLGKEPQDAYGMEEPSAVATLETPDKTVTLRVGAKDASGESYVVKSSESDYYVHVAASSLAPLVENGRDAFFEKPTPESESSES